MDSANTHLFQIENRNCFLKMTSKSDRVESVVYSFRVLKVCVSGFPTLNNNDQLHSLVTGLHYYYFVGIVWVCYKILDQQH